MVSRDTKVYTGQGMYFDGSTNCALFRNSSTDNQTNITVNIRFKIETWVDGALIFHMYPYFWVKTGAPSDSTANKIKVQLEGNSSDKDTFTTTTTFTAEEWYSLTFTVNGQDVNIYVDGTLDTSGTLTDSGLNSVSGGAFYINENANINMYVDDLLMYSTPLSANQIKALYKGIVPTDNLLFEFANGFEDTTGNSSSLDWCGTESNSSVKPIYEASDKVLIKSEIHQNILKHIANAKFIVPINYQPYFKSGDYIEFKRNYMDGVSSDYTYVFRGHIHEAKVKGIKLEITAYDMTETLKATTIYEPFYGATISEIMEYVIQKAGLTPDVTSATEKIQLYITNGATAYKILDDITSAFGWFFYYDADSDKIVCREMGYETNTNTLSTGSSGVIKGLPEWKTDMTKIKTKASVTTDENYISTQYSNGGENTHRIDNTTTTATQLIYLDTNGNTPYEFHMPASVYNKPTISYVLGYYARNQYTTVNVRDVLSSGNQIYYDQMNYDGKYVFPTPDTSTTKALQDLFDSADSNYDTNGTVRSKFRQKYIVKDTNGNSYYNTILYDFTTHFKWGLQDTLTTSDYFTITIYDTDGVARASTDVYCNGSDNELYVTFPDGVYLDADIYVEVEYKGSTTIDDENWMLTSVAGGDEMQYWDGSAWQNIHEGDSDVRSMQIYEPHVAQPASTGKVVVTYTYNIQLPKLGANHGTEASISNSPITFYISRNARHYFLAPPTALIDTSHVEYGVTDSSFIYFDDEDESDTGTADYILTSQTEDTTHYTAYDMICIDRSTDDSYKTSAVISEHIYQEFPETISGSPPYTTYSTTQQISSKGNHTTDITFTIDATITDRRWYAIEISSTDADSSNYADVLYSTTNDSFRYGTLFTDYSFADADLKFLFGYGKNEIPYVEYENTQASRKWGLKEKKLTLPTTATETTLLSVVKSYVDYYTDENNLKSTEVKLRDHETYDLKVGQKVSVEDTLNDVYDTFIILEYTHIYPYSADRIILGGDTSQFTALIKSVTIT